MRTNHFGSTGLDVSVLGLGAGQVGQDSVPEAEAGRVLNLALDLGITLVDTAHCYGLSEERIGRHIGHRRDEFVLSTKCGHDIAGTEDWTPQCVRTGVEDSLRRLRTDHVDVLHLHSCGREQLADGSLADTLDELQRAGKVRVVAYSGENDALELAATSGRFASVETSVNLADQWSLHHVLGPASAAGLGVIAKRPIANAAWRHQQRPDGVYGEVYWDRLRELDYDWHGMEPLEVALRFATFAPGVSSAIMGTADQAHLRRAVELVAAGPLPAELLQHLAQRWQQVGGAWAGEV